MNKHTLIFSQTLHGYNDGHTLLTSSVELPGETRRAMLNLSDMSGGNMERGFEEYLTGYPLKEVNLYAIAKTWYAPEMPRPGCVWTHTILINFSDIPHIANCKLLLSLFKRPQHNNYELYNSDLVVDEEISKADRYNTSQGLINSDLVKTILKELYSTLNVSVFVTSPNAYAFDTLFLMIWRQQWPRLKRNFSFCTGAVSPRLLNGVPMDLQVTPYYSDISNQIHSTSVNIFANQDFIKHYDRWVEVAFEDLSCPTVTLRRFLNYFGSDVDIKRRTFQTMLKTYTFFKDDKPQLSESILFLSEMYPSLKDGINLKNAILSREIHNFSSILPIYDELTLLFQLATTQHYQSFNYSKLFFFERFQRRFSHFDNLAVEVLKQIIIQSPNTFGENAITKLADVVTGNELHAIWNDRQLIAIFIGLNPKLTFNRDFWVANVNNQSEIINQLQRTDIDGNGWKILSSILIDIGSKIDANLLAGRNIELEKIILDKINENENISIGNNWLRFLRNNPKETLDWMNESAWLKPATANVLVDVLDPNSYVVINNGISIWLHFLENFTNTKLVELKIDIHIFCLALAFNTNSAETHAVFALTFENVYFALACDNVEYQLWQKLEVHTKPLSWLKDWDKCKKLINALVDHFFKNDLSVKQLISYINRDELKKRILRQYKKRE